MSLVSRAEAEDFLFHEAALLDEWKVKDWAALFTDDGEYMIPSTDDPHADPRTTLFLVFDDRHRLEERGKRLMSKAAHAEFPHSRTVHSYSNVNWSVLLPEVQLGRGARVTRCVIDRGCLIPDGMVIGEDAALDAQRFYRSENGITLVTREMLDKLAS